VFYRLVATRVESRKLPTRIEKCDPLINVGPNYSFLHVISRSQVPVNQLITSGSTSQAHAFDNGLLDERSSCSHKFIKLFNDFTIFSCMICNVILVVI